MKREYSFHAATVDDARDIASLIAISSDGVAVIEWAEAAVSEGVEPLDIGERTYRDPDGDYSWRNCTIVEKDGKAAGMLLAFGMPKGKARDPRLRPTIDDTNVFAPYMYLEEPDSWYVCGVALYPEHRGQGLGTQLMQLAGDQARQNGFEKVSLVAFAQNEGSVRLYQKLGYEIVDRAPIIPHPLIHYDGEALLMVLPLSE
jgi:ribosomal protein S18 acetylase RimI-like enzyme